MSLKQHKLIPEALRDEGSAVLVVYTKGHHDPAAFAAEVDAINRQAEAEDDDPEFPSVEPARVRQYFARVLPVGRGTWNYECGFTWTLDYPVKKRGPGVFPVTVYEAWHCPVYPRADAAKEIVSAPKCMRCLDRGLYWSEWSCAQVYCDCAAGKTAEEIGCLSNEDAGPQPDDSGDQ